MIVTIENNSKKIEFENYIEAAILNLKGLQEIRLKDSDIHLKYENEEVYVSIHIIKERFAGLFLYKIRICRMNHKQDKFPYYEEYRNMEFNKVKDLRTFILNLWKIGGKL